MGHLRPQDVVVEPTPWLRNTAVGLLVIPAGLLLISLPVLIVALAIH